MGITQSQASGFLREEALTTFAEAREVYQAGPRPKKRGAAAEACFFAFFVGGRGRGELKYGLRACYGLICPPPPLERVPVRCGDGVLFFWVGEGVRVSALRNLGAYLFEHSHLLTI